MKAIAGARIVEHREVARGTRWMVLEVEDGLPEPHAPGDVVAVYAPNHSGRWIRHPYSVSFAEGARFGVLYRVVRGGRTSTTMASLQPGDVLRLGGRFGEPIARLVEDAPALVGVSTGSGVGPLQGYARTADRPTVLLAGFREAVDVPFAAELSALGRPGFSWLPTLSAPDEAWRGLRGRVTARFADAVRALREAGVDPRRAHWHLVGNGAMTTDARDGLLAAGIDRSRVTTEAYFDRDTTSDARVVAAIVAALRA